MGDEPEKIKAWDKTWENQSWDFEKIFSNLRATSLRLAALFLWGILAPDQDPGPQSRFWFPETYFVSQSFHWLVGCLFCGWAGCFLIFPAHLMSLLSNLVLTRSERKVNVELCVLRVNTAAKWQLLLKVRLFPLTTFSPSLVSGTIWAIGHISDSGLLRIFVLLVSRRSSCL